MRRMRYDFFETVGEGLFSETLDNGLAVFIYPKKGFHKRFAHFAVHYGGSDMRFILDGKEQDSPPGVAHFLEHKLFDTRQGNALTLLAQHGASPNAYTGNGMTAYHFSCDEAHFFENLEILLSFVTEPYFTPESVTKEQGIIGQEIGMYADDPGHAAYMGLMRTLFRENPIRTDIAGSVESIAQITADTLYRCHGAFYVPENMALTVVGDVEPERVLDYARRLTPAAKGTIPGRCYGTGCAGLPESRLFRREMAVSMPCFYIGSSLQVPDSGAERQKCELLANLTAMLLCGESSALYGSLYEQGLINRSFAAGADFFPGGGVLLCTGESSRPEQIFDAYCQAAAAFMENGSEAADFQRLKNALTGECIFGLNSFDQICYNQAAAYFSGVRYLDQFAILEVLTEKDVLDFARQNLAPEKMALSVIAPASGKELN